MSVDVDVRCKHDLLEGTCSICLNDGQVPRPGYDWTQFTCLYQSRCEVCGERIVPHTRVLYRRKVVRHLSCGNQQLARPA